METPAWWVSAIGPIVEALGGIAAVMVVKLLWMIAGKLKVTETEKQAVEALAAGVTAAEDELVRNAKAAASDGTLTAAEIKAARELAIKHALTIAKGPAKNLLLSLGPRLLASWISDIVAARKGTVVAK